MSDYGTGYPTGRHAGQGHPREAIGAYVLGALEPDEAAEVRAHLEYCAECRAIYDDLADLPALLSSVSREDAERAAAVDQVGAERLVATVRSRRSRGRLFLVGAAAAALILAGGGVFAGARWLAPAPVSNLANPGSTSPGTGGSYPGGTNPDGTYPQGNPAIQWNATDPKTKVIASVILNPTATGTKVDVMLTGVHKDEVCALVVYDREGKKWPGGSWKVRYSDGLSWSGGVAVQPGQISRIDIIAHGYKRLVQVKG